MSISRLRQRRGTWEKWRKNMKTRNQRKREREQTFFILAVTAWIIAMVAVILYKAVHG
jgi:hypothetical protein